MKMEDSGFQRKSKRLGSGRSTRKLGKEEGRSVRILNFRCKLETSSGLGGVRVGGCQVDREPEEGRARTRCHGDRRAGAWSCRGLILHNVCCVLSLCFKKTI